MFDANMRCLPKGRYFADVEGCCNGALYDIGVRNNMVVMFDKHDDNDESPTVTVHHDGKSVEISYRDCIKENWLIYAGNYDLSGFINKRSLRLARDIISVNGGYDEQS